MPRSSLIYSPTTLQIPPCSAACVTGKSSRIPRSAEFLNMNERTSDPSRMRQSGGRRMGPLGSLCVARMRSRRAAVSSFVEQK